MFKMNFDAYRIGQLEAHQTILSLAPSKIVSIVLPTRYGKSDVIRCSYLDLYYQGLASCSVVLSPARNLQKQMIADDKIKEMFARYEIVMPHDISKFRPTASGTEAYKQWRNLLNTAVQQGPTLISTTHQFAVLHGISANSWLDSWVRDVLYTTKKPPIFYVDECHLGCEANKIGTLMKMLHDTGAYVAVLTATPYRADGDKIPGFEYEPISYDVIEERISKATGDPTIRLSQLRETLKCVYEMKADYAYSFADAWAEIPSPLSDIDKIFFDADVTKYVDRIQSGKQKKLSQLSGSDGQRILGRYVVRNPDVQRELIGLAIKELKRIRHGASDAAMIVFVGNDTEDEDNREARAVEKIIKKRDATLKVIIATSTTDNATDMIQGFVDGRGDVLIVKMMAGLGLDCKRLKVGVDLSPIRTIASFTQRLMRIATFYDKCKQGCWIMPHDAIGVELFHMIVTSNVGRMERVEGSRVLSEEEVEIDVDKKIEEWMVNNPELAGVQNNTNHTGKPEYWSPLQDFVSEVPEITNYVSRAKLMVAFEKSTSHAPNAAGGYRDLNQEIEDARSSIQDWRNAWVNNILRERRGHGYSGSNDNEYGKQHSECWAQMKLDLLLPSSWDVKIETDVAVLKEVQNYFQRKASLSHA